MVNFRTLLFASLVAVAYASPIEKRINQITSAATADWEKACLAAGGGQQCNPVSVKAFGTLLAGGGNCDQQNAADSMIDLAKKLKNNAEMIRLTQLFAQQPRNAPDKLQVPYCRVAPRNKELNGLFHCQFAGSDFTKFSGDQKNNLPLGVTKSPKGSCPAHPQGPIPDGVQLNTLVKKPRAKRDEVAAIDEEDFDEVEDEDFEDDEEESDLTRRDDHDEDEEEEDEVDFDDEEEEVSGIRARASFTRANGVAAKKQNAAFAKLNANSRCSAGQNACVGGKFAQCLNGKFVLFPCAGGLTCASLPLVNKPGTSITCTTAADRDARIKATGA